MVPTQKTAAENLVALVRKKAVLKEAAALIVGARKEAAEKQIQKVTRKPGGLHKKAVARVAAEFIKTARVISANRKTALTKAAASYQRALKSGNRGHIKKATAHLAEVLTLARLEKGALGPPAQSPPQMGGLGDLSKLLKPKEPALGRPGTAPGGASPGPINRLQALLGKGGRPGAASSPEEGAMMGRMSSA